MKSDHLGGVKALDWRKRVARVSRNFNMQGRDAYNRTFKFPLEINGDLSGILPNAEKLYDIVEGTDKGSLTALVFAIHLSGFRLFSKKAETEVFETDFPDKHFRKTAEKIFPNSLTEIVPSNIYTALKCIPKNQERATWDTKHILSKLEKELGITKKKNENLDNLFLRIADNIHKKHASWQEVAEKPAIALTIFSNAFREINRSFPDFSQIETKIIEPENRTLAYDPKMSFYDMKDEATDYQIYHCISVIVRSLPQPIDPEKIKNEIKNRFTTKKHNGLSWLFGVGLKWLQEDSLEKIAEKLGVPSQEKRRVEQLQAFAKALPKQDPLWGKAGFRVFCTSVGGKLDSWISNYWNRLDALQYYFDQTPTIEIPTGLDEERHNNLFSGSNVSAHDLRQAVDNLPQKMNRAKEQLKPLQGKAEYKENSIKKIEEVTEYLGSLLGKIEILNNRIEQTIENKETPAEKQKLEKLKVQTKNIKKPEQLNRIGGGAINADKFIKEIESSLSELIKTKQKHYEDLMKYAANSGQTDPLPNLTDLEEKKLRDRKHSIDKAKENAQRWLLHKFAILANRMSEVTRGKLIETVKEHAFHDRKVANRFFYNRQGAIYVSPYSRRRHDPLPLTQGALDRDWLGEAESLLKWVKEKLSQSETPDVLRDMLVLEDYIFATRLRCLPDSIPASLGKRSLEMHEEKRIFVPSVIREQLTNSSADSTVSRDVILKLFNLYTVAINGLQFKAFRREFITRVVFSRLGTDKLVYVPKEKEWTPPKPYFKGESPIARALQEDWIVWKEERHVIDVPSTFIKLCEKLRTTEKDLMEKKEAPAYLSQAPHDWWLQLDIEEIGEGRCGMTVNTSGPSGTYESIGKSYKNLIRLQGPSSRKTILDRILQMKISNNKLKLGDPNLIMDTHYLQTAELQNGLPHIKATKRNTRMEAAICLIDKSAPDETFDMYNRIVAIDQGERGIGYAVFDLQKCIKEGQFKPMTDPDDRKPVTGVVSVPSIRSLIHTVRNHRRRHQPRQKINMTYSTLLQQRRENVVGDVCNRIDTLCEKYNAFPVLESTVGNLESGGRQLQLVYNSVSKMYLRGDNDAQNNKRKHKWGFPIKKDSSWKHPWLMKRKYDSQKKEWSDISDDLYKLYPGASVAPAGTSQTCHRCGRNPVRQMENIGSSHLHVDRDGRIDLNDGKIRLCGGSIIPKGEDQKTFEKQLRKRNERPPLDKPIERGKENTDKLLKLLRRNLRRPPKSLQSPDTTQSRYHCVYIDCDFTGHADENAAINIGVKFLKERVHLKESRENLKRISK